MIKNIKENLKLSYTFQWNNSIHQLKPTITNKDIEALFSGLLLMINKKYEQKYKIEYELLKKRYYRLLNLYQEKVAEFKKLKTSLA